MIKDMLLKAISSTLLPLWEVIGLFNVGTNETLLQLPLSTPLSEHNWKVLEAGLTFPCRNYSTKSTGTLWCAFHIATGALLSCVQIIDSIGHAGRLLA